jgi:hypothetical protein
MNQLDAHSTEGTEGGQTARLGRASDRKLGLSRLFSSSGFSGSTEEPQN